MSRGVSIEHVTFGYDPARPILHDITFTAEPGQTVALVGHTGSGKSTIVNLAGKFHLPTRGTEVRLASVRELPGKNPEITFAYVRTSKIATMRVRDEAEMKAAQTAAGK